MRETMRKVLGVMIASVSALACSSAPADKYPSPDAFCAAKAVEECQHAAGCAVPADQCQNARHALCMNDANTAQVEGRKYTSGNVQACVDKTHSIYLKEPITPTDMAEANDVCARVFQGSVAAGGPCTDDYQCSGSAICTKGACGNKVTKNPGDFCGNPGEVCINDSYCSAAAPVKCLADAKQGEPCNKDIACSTAGTPALRCLGTCQPVQPAGGKCVTNADCDPKSAPYCDLDNGGVCDDGVHFVVSNKGLCAHYGGTP